MVKCVAKYKVADQSKLIAYNSLTPAIKSFVSAAKDAEYKADMDFILSMYDVGKAGVAALNSVKRCSSEQIRAISICRGKREKSIYEAIRVVRLYSYEDMLDIVEKAHDNGVSVTWPFFVALSMLDEEKDNDYRKSLEQSVISGSIRHSTLSRHIQSSLGLRKKKQAVKVQSTMDDLVDKLSDAALYLRRKDRSEDVLPSLDEGSLSEHDSLQVKKLHSVVSYLNDRCAILHKLTDVNKEDKTVVDDNSSTKLDIASIKRQFKRVKDISDADKIPQHNVVSIYDLEED